MTDLRTSGASESVDPLPRSATLKSSLSRSSVSFWDSTKTQNSLRTSGATTSTSSRTSCGCIAPPSPGRQRTSVEGQGAPLARAPHPRSSRPYLRHLRLDALASMPVRPSPSLLSLQRGGRLRQRHPPQADLLRPSGARKGLLAWGDHPHLGGPGQRPRAFCAPRTRRGNFWADHRRPQLPFAEDQAGVGGYGCGASGPVLLQKQGPYPEKERLPQSASLPDRHRLFAAHRALLRKEGAGARHVASGKQTAAQSPLSHTVAFLLNHQIGNPPLQLSKLII